MSGDAMRWARSLPGLTWPERMVVCNLADHCPKGQDRAWPSVPTIAEEEGLSVSTVRRALRRLEQRGHILSQDPGGGYRTVTTYLLGIHGRPVTQTGLFDPEDRSERPKTGQRDHKTGHTDHKTGQSDRRTKEEPERNQRGTRQTLGHALERVTPEVLPAPAPNGAVEREPAGFREFWSAWPRKVARSDAMRALERAYRRDGVDRVAAGLWAWVGYWVAEGTDERYVPHAATWLNRSQYLDTPPAPARPRDPTGDLIRARKRARGEL